MLFACDATNCHYLCNAPLEHKNFQHAKTNSSLNVDYLSEPGNCIPNLRTEGLNLVGTQSTAVPEDSPNVSPMPTPLDSLSGFSPVHRLGLRQGPVSHDMRWSMDGSPDSWGLSQRPAQSSRAQSVPRPRMSHGLAAGVQRTGDRWQWPQRKGSRGWPGYDVMPDRARIHPAPPNPRDNEDRWIGEVVATSPPPPPPSDSLRYGAVESDEVLVGEIKDHVTQIFQACSPSKVLEVDYLFRKYEGLERELYARICKKYRVPPNAAYLPHETEEKDAAGRRHEMQCVPAIPPADSATLAGFLSAEGFRGVNAHRVKLPVEWCYPLHVAVAMNDAHLVRLLLAARGDPSLGDSAGLTPLHLAHDICTGESGAAVREALAAATKQSS